EIGSSPDDLQELVHPLYYVCQRSTTFVSIGHGCVTSAGSLPVPELPKLHDRMNLVSKLGVLKRLEIQASLM
ncbi:hypothetical protein SOVF_207460, partial [Spinacia oleracea]